MDSYHWNFGGTNFKIKKIRVWPVPALLAASNADIVPFVHSFTFKILKGSSSDGLKKKTSCHDCGNEVFPSKHTPLKIIDCSKLYSVVFFCTDKYFQFNSRPFIRNSPSYDLCVAGNTKQIHHVNTGQENLSQSLLCIWPAFFLNDCWFSCN